MAIEMRDIWVSEDIADNLLLLDPDVLREEVESKGGTWNVDDCCKSFVDNPNVKMPLAYVDKHGKVFFNKIAKKWESPEKIERSLSEIWARDTPRKPSIVLLTHSLKELAEVAPDLGAYIRMLKWRGPK
jgi:hypothetical protein